MDKSLLGKRESTGPPDEEFNTEVGLKLILDVIRNLNSEQISVVQSIGFGTILQVSCSFVPHDIFNWLAIHMDTSTGCIEFQNGFSFTISRECVQMIMNLPIGLQPISFCSSPDILQSVNVEIHGIGRTPSVYELASLIKNGLCGTPFAKAFVLLVNCLLLCPTNQIVPSSCYYNAICDVDKINQFDWCSYVLHWLLLSVNKYQLNGLSGNCSGCGLIPVITYFEFLIVSEVHLGKTIPRLPLWTDDLLKLYAILDCKEQFSFGKLPVKHLCSTPFAHSSKKNNSSYNLPVDVVSFIESTYNSEEQNQVKKKLKTLSTNLRQTMLTSTTQAISNCVDEVLRAFCNQDSSNPTDAALFFKEGSLHCDDLLLDPHIAKSDNKLKQPAASEGSRVIVKDATTSTREMVKDIICYYMDRSFPPFPEMEIKDEEPDLFVCVNDIFTALVRKLPIIEQDPMLDFVDVDDYLCRELVTKVEIPIFDDGYEEMSNLDLCKLNLKPLPPSPPLAKEEKIDFSSWFDCSKRFNCQGAKEDIHTNLGRSKTYGLSLNEHLTGIRPKQPQQISESEYPEWNFSDDSQSPITPMNTRSIVSCTRHVSFEETMDSPTQACPPARHVSFKETMDSATQASPPTGTHQQIAQHGGHMKEMSLLYPSSVSFEATQIGKSKKQQHAFVCSPVKNSQDEVPFNNYFASLPNSEVPPFQRYAIAVSGADCIGKQSVQFLLANTLGLPVKE